MKWQYRNIFFNKRISITVLLAFASILITAFLIFINDIVVSIRLSELKINLQDLDRTESSMDHIGLITTYQINKNIYDKKLSQENADALEEKIISLIIKEEKDSVKPAKYSIISKPALMLINLNRGILGKPPIAYRQAQNQNIDLDIAYYYERNFIFDRAITLYNKALKNKNINSTLTASILLHQGYCYALAGLNDKAMNNYVTIIKKYSQENSAITATILARYLEGFKAARETVLSSNADPLLMSQNLVNLLAYEQAFNILKDAERTAAADDLPRIKYYIARCYTGLGKPEKAVENYLHIITSLASSQYARLSNRKLFIIGARAGGDNNIIKISKQLNKKINDPVLSQMIQNQVNAAEPADNIKELTKYNIPENMMEKVDKIAGKAKNTYLIIMTSDGNTFKGNLIEQNSKEVSIRTSIGIINVKRNKIIKMNIVE